MKSCYKRYEAGQIHTRKEYFDYFEKGYHCFIRLDSGEYTKEEALEHIEELSRLWYEKHKECRTTYSTPTVSFF